MRKDEEEKKYDLFYLLFDLNTMSLSPYVHPQNPNHALLLFYLVPNATFSKNIEKEIKQRKEKDIAGRETALSTWTRDLMGLHVLVGNRPPHYG